MATVTMPVLAVSVTTVTTMAMVAVRVFGSVWLCARLRKRVGMRVTSLWFLGSHTLSIQIFVTMKISDQAVCCRSGTALVPRRKPRRCCAAP